MDKDNQQLYADKLGQHSAKWLRSRYSTWILALIAFLESAVAPIIIDPFLVAMILAKRERWITYTIISIVSSVAGGVVGYFLGAIFYDFIGRWVIDFYGLHNQFVSMADKLDKDAFAFVLIGAFTPIPYKLVAIASGLAHLNFGVFILASMLGRILRLGLVGAAANRFGPQALLVAQRNLLNLAYVTAIILIVYIALRLFA